VGWGRRSVGRWGAPAQGELIGALVLGAPGVAVGAAGGVTLATPDGRGALHYSARAESWNVGPPAVQVRPGVGPEPSAVGRVSLVTVDL
jgi:hypothetical protein